MLNVEQKNDKELIPMGFSIQQRKKNQQLDNSMKSLGKVGKSPQMIFFKDDLRILILQCQRGEWVTINNCKTYIELVMCEALFYVH